MIALALKVLTGKMKFFAGTLLLLFLLFVFVAQARSATSARRLPTARDSYDVIVAGGGTGGIAAAIQAARLGCSVLVVENSGWIGGQAIAAGVSTMDDFSRIKSGLYLEFFSKFSRYYASRGKSVGTCYWDPRTVAFEPHVGQAMLLELVDETRRRRGTILDILPGLITGVKREGKQVRGVTLRTQGGTRPVACKVLIDATEYGDILPLARAAYRVGNSAVPFVKPEAMIQDITWVAVIKKYPGGVPSDLRPFNPLPGYDLAKRNYESCVTADGANFKNTYPVATPVNFVSHNAYRGLPDSSSPWDYDASRENWPYITKTCVNWGNDYPGTYGWEGRRGLPVAYLEDPVLRAQVERDALIKTLHFIYYIQNELGEDWSVADDEYWNATLPPAAAGLPYEWQEIARRMPPIPYVRESRRIVGDYTLTSSEVLQNSLSYRDGQTSHEFSDAIAIGGYHLDLHGAATDGDMEWQFEERAVSAVNNRPRGPFQVPMRVLIPQEIDGLLAAEKNLSVSRLSAGALRLQPITMMTGQAAGALAALSIQAGVRPRDLPAVRVQWALLNAGVELSLCNYTDVPPGHPLHKSVQIMNLYGLIDPAEYPHAPSYDISDLDDPVLAMAIIKGNDKGRFGVDEMVTRRQTVLMIERTLKALGLPGPVPELGDKPENFISRGDFAKELCDAFTLAEVTPARGARSPFRASKNRNAEVIEVLGPLGVLDIYKRDPDFKFGRPVTRGEAADMLARAMVAVDISQ
ncbi:MAG: FAD-dependent oxidoreductase [Synergistaceae bacterium]|nr:FAD-dependent oxidoreductase [Synergistaceae bacterium]